MKWLVAFAMVAACGDDDAGVGVDAAVVDAGIDAVAVDARGPVSRVAVTYEQALSPMEIAYPPLPATVVIDGVAARDAGGGMWEFPEPALGTPVHAVITSAALAAPVELQWTHGVTDAHFVVPVVGRQGVGDEVPAGSGWSVAVTGGPVTFPRTLGLSTGAWTEGRKGASGPTPFTYELAQLGATLAGVRAAPGVVGDQGVLLAMPLLGGTGSCVRSTSGSVTFPAPALVAGTLSTAAGTWDATTTTLAVTWPRDVIRGRFAAQLGLLAGVEGGRLAFGYMPSHALPAFTRDGGADDRGVARALPIVPMLTVAECPVTRDETDVFAPVAALEAGARATAHVQVTSTRSFVSLSGANLSLTSGLDIASATTGSGAATHAATFALTAPLPRSIKLIQASTTVDLVGDADGGMLLGTQDLDLQWAAHAENGEVADYWSVTLVAVTPTSQTPVREFRLPASSAPHVTFSASLLLPGTEYTFVLRAHTGYPLAIVGDFSLPTFPQSMTTVATRTFRRG